MDPAQPPQLLRVCPKHGLVAGPDGRCVICHRNDGEAAKPSAGRPVLMVALICATVVGGVLVWKGARGRRHAEPVETVVVVSAPRPPAQPPDDEGPQRSREETIAEARRADAQQRARDVEAAMARVPITMYVDGKCAMCDTARDWMRQKGMHWSEVDVTDPASLQALKKLTPNPSVPTFDVGGEVLVGFGASSLLGAVRRVAEKQTP